MDVYNILFKTDMNYLYPEVVEVVLQLIVNHRTLESHRNIFSIRIFLPLACCVFFCWARFVSNARKMVQVLISIVLMKAIMNAAHYL